MRQNIFDSKAFNMRVLITLLIYLFAFLCVGQSQGDSLNCFQENEVQECVQACPPERTCTNKDIYFRCMNDDKRCQIKCVCKAGFYRNYNRDCVSAEVCDLCPLNEVFSCGSACQTTCATLNQVCPIVNIKCNEGCYCRAGYARNKYGTCIPISKCNK